MKRWLVLLLVLAVVMGYLVISPAKSPDPMAFLYIETLISRDYPVSEIKIEEMLPAGSNYQRYIASYLSDGWKIYGLLTVPNSDRVEDKFPTIVMLHGYLDPTKYQTTERYVAYQDGLARNGWVTFKPDLRGHGKSAGMPVNSNFNQDYVVDTLNLISALKSYQKTNPKLIGLWGHSNGGGIALRTIEASKDIKATVIWAGVVGSYEDLLINYRSKIPWIGNEKLIPNLVETNTNSPYDLVKRFGEPRMESPFWSKMDPYSYIQKIESPVQLHHGSTDDSVPIQLSQHLYQELKNAGKIVEFYEYDKGDHNISSPDFKTAMLRTVEFFERYLR
ncbi:MAG: alpha/beta fold hydrolase [Microgenomates group bacterium]